MTLPAILALACCTSGSSTGGTTGSVALALGAGSEVITADPPLLASVAHVDVTLAEVDIHVAAAGDENGPRDDEVGDDDGRWRSVVLPAGTTLDLMELQNGVTASLGGIAALPAGKITQIRLRLDAQGQRRVVLANGAICSLDLSHVPPTGVKVVDPFAVIDLDGRTRVRVVLDLDVVRSLRKVGACAYVLDPVIRVDGVERGDADDDHPDRGRQ